LSTLRSSEFRDSRTRGHLRDHRLRDINSFVINLIFSLFLRVLHVPFPTFPSNISPRISRKQRFPARVRHCGYPRDFLICPARVDTLPPSPIRLSTWAPLDENWASRNSTCSPLSIFLFRFRDARDKPKPSQVSLSLSRSLPVPLLDPSKEIGVNPLPGSFPLVVPIFRTHFFSHWKLRHLCRFRDYFCRSVLSGETPQGEGRASRSQKRATRSASVTGGAQPAQWATALLAFQNGIYRK